MPERQIPWRTVAKRLSGDLDVTTGVAGTQVQLTAEVGDVIVLVEATSAPYARRGGRTEIRAHAGHPRGTKIFVTRNLGTVPLYRRFLLRDVVIGAPIFDEGWIINASRESYAQAFLDAEVCSLIDLVPVSRSPASYVSELREVYYDFRLGRGEAVAYTDNFEADPNRLIAAINAVVALATQYEKLLGQWRTLAHDLDGKFEHGRGFLMDGTTRIRIALHGRPVYVAPVIVALTWRRDRLRTRIRCETAGRRPHGNMLWKEGDEMQELGDLTDTFKSAVEESQAIYVRSTSKLVEVQLDGNVRNPTRIIAAGSLAALLAQGSELAHGPYR
jgi:hypothetical protein